MNRFSPVHCALLRLGCDDRCTAEQRGWQKLLASAQHKVMVDGDRRARSSIQRECGWR